MNAWPLPALPVGDDHYVHETKPARRCMAGGGTAPSMKMSDVFLLVGMSILVGGLIMHAWVSPASLDGDSQSRESGASMLKGDTLTFELTADTPSSVSIVIGHEGGEEVIDESWTLASGEEMEFVYEATEGGFYVYNVTFESGDGEVLVDVDRKTGLDFVAYPIGVAMIGFGLYKRSIEEEDVIDAELED